MWRLPLATYFTLMFRLNTAVRTKVENLDFLENYTNTMMGRTDVKPFHRRRVTWYPTIKKTCSKEATKCEKLVKDTISSMDCSAVEHIDGCIGAVLSSDERTHRLECCEPGTEYDDFVLSDVPEKASFTFDKQTAVFIIDVQRDFTTGSFGQPCWGTGGDSMLQGIVEFSKKAAAAGATIIASKDFHPADHCSFNGESHCMNTKGYTNSSFGPGKRYVNEFPSHTSWSGFKSSRGTNFAQPQFAPDTPFCKILKEHVFKGPPPMGHFCANGQYVGADLERELARALKELPQDQVEVVFKGFNKEYDSFSATPHLVGAHSDCEGCTKYTGGFAIPSTRAQQCHGNWHKIHCHPTDKEMADPMNEMRSVLDILNKKNINKIYVTGLVYDFCVKETALFAKEAAITCQETPSLKSNSGLCDSAFLKAGYDTKVTVVANLARPSFDGKPGSPYVSAVCDGGQAEGSFCTQGGGTTAAHKAVFKELTDIGVEVVREKRFPHKCRY